MRVTIIVDVDGERSEHTEEVTPPLEPVLRAVFSAWQISGNSLAKMAWSGFCWKILRLWRGGQAVALSAIHRKNSDFH